MSRPEPTKIDFEVYDDTILSDLFRVRLDLDPPTALGRNLWGQG